MMGANRSLDDEKEVLEGLIKGRAEAFTRLYYRYGGKLHTHLLRMVKSEEIAREILQDIFMKVWEFRDRIDPDKPFAPYIYRIAQNRVYDHFRKIARERRMEETLIGSVMVHHNDTEDDLMYQEGFQLLTQAIEQLPPARKQIYLLRKVEDRTYDEIAGLLGISVSTVNDHMVKANRFLKKAMVGHIDAVISVFILFTYLV